MNHELEDLMKMNVETATAAEQNRFLNKLKQSQLHMPVTMEDEVGSDEVGFSINYIIDEDGNWVVPLFTSEEMMQKAGLNTKTMLFQMNDLAELMRQAGDKYHTLAINPFTDLNINMPMPMFIGLFEEDKAVESLNVILKLLKEKCQVLDEEYRFYFRSDDDLMFKEAVDDVFAPEIPFNVSSNRDFHNELKYLDILLMGEGTRILFLADVLGPDSFDTVIAPMSQFKLVESLDECTRVWRCEHQPFYD